MGTILSWLAQRLGIKSKKQQYKQEVMSETANVDFCHHP